MNVYISNMKVAEKQLENERMDEMERKALPAILSVLGAITLMILGGAADSYADIRNESSIKNEAVFAECLKGKRVSVDGSIARCQVVSYVLVGGAK